MRLSLAADSLFILPPKWFFVKPYFLEAFELSELGHSRSFSEQTGTFRRLLVLFKGFLLRLRKSFFCLSAWRSHIVPHSTPFGKPFFKLFRHFSFFVYKVQFFIANKDRFGYISYFLPTYTYYKYPMRFGASIYEAQTKLHICRRAGTDMEFCFSHSVFSSCFICRRVSQTASASRGSIPIRPMGMGPNTL